MIGASVTKRGANSWRARVSAGRDPATGRRKVITFTVKAETKREALTKVAEQVAAIGANTYVEPSKVTIAEHVGARIKQWRAAGEIGDKTAERYTELFNNQMAPFIGALLVQKLKPADVEKWHTTLRESGRKDRKGGVSARTIANAHKLLRKALNDAVRLEVSTRNVAGKGGQVAPKVAREEATIIPAERIGEVMEKLRGRAIFRKFMVSLLSGVRRGELLGLRLCDVDFDGKAIDINGSLEETKAHGLRRKDPKSKAGRRIVSLPDAAIDALREQRRDLLEQRMARGLGRMADDDYMFPALDFGPFNPRQLSSDWAEIAAELGLDGVGWHCLRHTHASALIDAGVDIVRISKRLGHSSPAITLAVYSHLFRKRDEVGVDQINAALAKLT